MPWQTATRILVPTQSPVDNQALFLSSYTNTFQAAGAMSPGGVPAPNVWHDLDLTTVGVPTNARAVDLRAFLIITAGKRTQTADLAVAFQVPGGNMVPGQYDEQTITCGLTGSRTNGSAICPAINGHINWAWLRGDNELGEWPDKPIAAYPAGATYGLNITVQAVFLP